MDTSEKSLADGELSPKFISDEHRELFAQALMADEAARFFESDLAKFLKGQCDQDVEDVKRRLLATDPDDAKEIRRLQTEAAVASRLFGYIEETLKRGELAITAMKHIEGQYND